MGFLTSDTKEEKKPKKKEFKKRPRPNKNRERNFSKTKGKTKSKQNNRNIKGGNKKRGPNSERVANEGGKKNSMNATATKDRKVDGNKTQKAGSEKRKPKEFKKSPPKKKTPLLKEKIKTDTTPEVIKEKKPLKSGKDCFIDLRWSIPIEPTSAGSESSQSINSSNSVRVLSFKPMYRSSEVFCAQETCMSPSN